MTGTVGLVLQALGAVFVGKVALSVATYFYQAFLKLGLNLKKYRRDGDWAVVTGATDGIGRAYAAALAAKGFNLLIVSRTQAKLDAVEKELLAANPGISVRTHRLDFTDLSPSSVDPLLTFLRELQVAVLVNNVAVNVEMPTYFEEVDLTLMRNIVSCNTLGTALLTHAVLPQMKARKRGVVVNLSSIGGTVPSAMLQPYGATKAFVENFSEALAEETAKHGIVVQCNVPYFVKTAMANRSKASTLIPEPEAFVAASLAKLGTAKTLSPYWSHALVLFALGCLPHALVVPYVHNLHVDIRKRSIRKKERQAQQGKKD